MNVFCVLLGILSLVMGSVYLELVNFEDPTVLLLQTLAKKEWWETAVLYQIYPRSFKDSDNNGIGDLQGIIQKLGYLKDLGIDGVWLSPIFKSPMVDFGYDIQDYYQVDPIFGTNDDLDRLILECKRLGIKLFLDFVPNHTSDQHEWFIKSENRDSHYTDYYIWHDGRPNPDGGRPLPPNNWRSVFTLPAWTWSEKRQQYYLHQFTAEQPDVNFRNPSVILDFQYLFNYYLGKGVDGFRIDAVNHAFEDPEFRDELMYDPEADPNDYGSYYHNHTRDMPESYNLVYDWRDQSDIYYLLRELEPRILMTEAYTETLQQTMDWFRKDDRLGAHIAFNFKLIAALDENSSPVDFEREIQEWMNNLPEGAVPNWVLGNHDRPRVAYRYGDERAEQMAILELLLPGIAVIYYGEEIGMTDNRDITWEETKDPQACNTNENIFQLYTRDPVRTPFQWDNTINAGFNEGGETWLPLHKNYPEVNLKAQKESEEASVYKLYQKLIEMRRGPAFTHGDFHIKAMGNILVFSRNNHQFVVLINFSGTEESVNLEAFYDRICCDAQVSISNREYLHGEPTNLRAVRLGGYDAIVLHIHSNSDSGSDAGCIKIEILMIYGILLTFFLT